MNVTPTTNLRCVVERITYQNPENGYSVLKVRVKGYSDLVTLVGSLLEVPVGSVLLCRGEWKVDKRYGSQFVAATWEETMPATVYGIEKYLGSGLVKGIGPRFARAIVQRFGTETIDIIETDIERLYEVPNIGRKRVAKIRESWEKQKDIKNVMLFLQGYGVSTAYAAKIYREYGKESIEKVRENPTVLPTTSGASASRPPTASPGKWAMRRKTRGGVGAVSSIHWDNSRTKGTSMPKRSSW